MSRSRPSITLCTTTGLFLTLALAGCGPFGATNSASAPTTPVPTASTVRVPPAADIAPPYKGLPVRTVTKKGVPGDPVNVAFEGSRDTILSDFHKIGWVEADPLSPRNDVRLAEDTIARRLYPAAPVSSLYLLGRKQDVAVEQELGSTARRNHARLWDTGRSDPTSHLELWIGDASRDIGIEILRSPKRRLPIGTTHHIDPNVDAERDLIQSSLRAKGVVATVVMEPGMGRTTNARNGGGDPFHTDGQVALIVLNKK